MDGLSRKSVLTLFPYVAAGLIKENTMKSNTRLTLFAIPVSSSKRKLSIQKHPEVVWTPVTYLALGSCTKSVVRWGIKDF